MRTEYSRDPQGPLFRTIDSDDGLGRSYERLRKFATIRVPIDLPTTSASGLVIRKCNEPSATKAILNRGNPSVFNAALELHLMHDGREGSDLERQAFTAVLTHNEPTREPTPQEEDRKSVV